MDTKELIVETANNFLVEKGFNAFSYKHISQEIDIKTSSIHYHFPTKSDLGIAIIRKHQKALDYTIEKCKGKTALEKIEKLFKYYEALVEEQKVCIVSALTSDINSLDETMKQELLQFGNIILNWIATILEEGQQQQIFKPIVNNKLKAKLIMANLMGLIQIARIEKNSNQINQLAKLILDDLIIDK